MKSLFAALAVAAFALATPAMAAGPNVCDPKAEISRYFAPDAALVFKIKDADLPKLLDYFTQYFGGPPPEPVGSIYIAADQKFPPDVATSFLFHDVNGCGMAGTDGWSPQEVEDIFNLLGIDPPTDQDVFMVNHPKVGIPL